MATNKAKRSGNRRRTVKRTQTGGGGYKSGRYMMGSPEPLKQTTKSWFGGSSPKKINKSMIGGPELLQTKGNNYMRVHNNPKFAGPEISVLNPNKFINLSLAKQIYGEGTTGTRPIISAYNTQMQRPTVGISGNTRESKDMSYYQAANGSWKQARQNQITYTLNPTTGFYNSKLAKSNFK